MAAEQKIEKEYYESAKLAKYPFEPYWPEKKLRICVTGGTFQRGTAPHEFTHINDSVMYCFRSKRRPVAAPMPRAAGFSVMPLEKMH